MKTCGVCGKSLDLSCFYKRAASNDGLSYKCKQCCSEYTAQYRKANREVHNKRNREWRNANLEKSRKASRESAKRKYHADIEAARDHARAKAVQWRARNPNWSFEQWKAWRKKYPERAAAIAENERLKRAARLAAAPGGKFDPSRPDYAARVALYGGVCGYCRKRPFEALDHIIPVSRGGSNFAANIMPACTKCNCRKNAKKYRTEWVPRAEL